MNRVIILCTMLMIAAGSTTADGKNATFYRDGVIIEQESIAHKGVLEIPLPSGMIEGSLRIRPGSGTLIQRVDILPIPVDTGKAEKDLDTLLEQKNRLGDRLQALATREEIFKSAAKSQSGKAPRKTKTNPEPMQSIRQGTEFAIAQLEAVYTAHRKTEQEIRRLDNRIAAIKNSGRGAGSRVRIVLSPLKGNVTIRYAVSGQSWTPHYDIYLDGSGSARVNLSGQFPETFNGYLLQASPALLNDNATARVFSVHPGQVTGLARYTLGATDEFFEKGVISSFSFELRNLEPGHLPAGEANIYHKGEYVGRLRFEGISSGGTRKVSVNK